MTFGPGGSAYKDHIAISQAAANRISRVSPDCSVQTMFQGNGVENPRALAYSPGGAWGHSDVLYLINENTVDRIDRIDRKGNLAPFASRFGRIETFTFSIYDTQPFTRLQRSATMATLDPVMGVIEQILIGDAYMFPEIPSTYFYELGVSDSELLSFDFGLGAMRWQILPKK